MATKILVYALNLRFYSSTTNIHFSLRTSEEFASITYEQRNRENELMGSNKGFKTGATCSNSAEPLLVLLFSYPIKSKVTNFPALCTGCICLVRVSIGSLRYCVLQVVINQMGLPLFMSHRVSLQVGGFLLTLDSRQI